MRGKLDWAVDPDFQTETARCDSFEYVVSQPKNGAAELRVIRRENMGGTIVQMQDFSIYARDRKAARSIAKGICKQICRARGYNQLSYLHQ